MAVVPFPRARGVEEVLGRAIRDRRLISFMLHGLPRRGEPHDYGIIGGVHKLFFYQVGGRSRSGRPSGWRWAVVDEMSEVRVLDDHFAGSRDSGSGRHVDWDVLLASVSREVTK